MTLLELQQSLEENPEDWSLRLRVVEALVAQGHHDSAVEVVNGGQALPREPQPWLDAARCYAAVGALEQARGLVASSLEIDHEFAPAHDYREELEARIAAMPVVLSADDVDESAESVESVESEGGDAVQIVAADGAAETGEEVHEVVLALQEAEHGEPIALPQVSFSNEEMDALHAAEEESRRQHEASIKRDRFNSVMITIILHVVIILLLTVVATKVPPRVPPQIVASAATEQQQDIIEDTKMEKPTVDPTTAVNSAVADIISVTAESSFSVSSLDVPIADVAMENVASFNPSMSLGMPASSESKMMFGQPMEGEVLGVILDVSGSMAEFLPMVVREVDKNFKDSPVVYVRNMLLRNEKADAEVRLIIPEEVIPYNQELKTRTPYWFLWHDLPRKAPQRYVDRLIETFKTRPNQFLVTGQWDHSRVHSALDFLMEEEIDSLYIFSDFEDFVDEDIALTLGQKLGRRKIRTYLQPAVGGTEFLDVMTKKVANRTLGRQMPSLVSILGGGGVKEEPTSLLPPKPEKKELSVDATYAKPRKEMIGKEFYSFKPRPEWKEIHRLSEPEYEAVFYGPEARVAVFLKDDNGDFIQEPITFHYHSIKEIPDHPDPRYRYRHRKFLRLEEEPSFDGKEIVWKMILEDELKFEVHLYLGRKGMNATYVAEPPSDETYDHAYIYFRIPSLARERNDLYFGQDFPAEGVKLDEVREVVQPNEVIFNLPRQFRDRFGTRWAQKGFEPGYNTRKYDELIRQLPEGVRDLVVQGPSFGPRKFHARTTSSKILLNGGAHRSDIEPWESFHARLVRSRDERTRFTKTEAIQIEIE